MQKSAYLLGRKPARALFETTGQVVLSAVDCLSGTARHWRMYVEAPTDGPAGPSVLYRIRVRRKPCP